MARSLDCEYRLGRLGQHPQSFRAAPPRRLNRFSYLNLRIVGAGLWELALKPQCHIPDQLQVFNAAVLRFAELWVHGSLPCFLKSCKKSRRLLHHAASRLPSRRPPPQIVPARPPPPPAANLLFFVFFSHLRAVRSFCARKRQKIARCHVR